MKNMRKYLSATALGSALWWATEHLLDKGVSHLLTALESALRR